MTTESQDPDAHARQMHADVLDAFGIPHQIVRMTYPRKGIRDPKPSDAVKGGKAAGPKAAKSKGKSSARGKLKKSWGWD